LFDAAGVLRNTESAVRASIDEMKQPLAFASMDIVGCDTAEQDPDNRNHYLVKRKAGSDLRFKATLNRPPVPLPAEDDGSFYEAYPGYILEYHVSGAEHKSFWTVDSWASLPCPPGTWGVTITAKFTKRPTEGEGTIEATMSVITSPLSEEEKLHCAHPSSRVTEGEWWGGCSGTCQVELITSCVVCGAELSKTIEHRD
jgi:hypothetical protein